MCMYGHIMSTNICNEAFVIYIILMQIVSDAERLLGDLSNSITRQTGFDAVMRVRASTGTEHICWFGCHMCINT